MKEEIKITGDLIDKFAELSGDYNPLHVDEQFAKRTFFKKRIAHGTILLAKISTLLTQQFGEGNILLTEEIKFLKPVYIDDKINLSIENIKENKGGISETLIVAKNQKKEKVLECKATCKNIYKKWKK